MDNKERFFLICREYIKRDGIENLLCYLDSNASDFFTAPASTRYHGACAGGLLEHSLNVYDCLKSYIKADRAKDLRLDYPDETIAIVSLFHDVCKVNCYRPGTRNVKDEKGVWHTVATYEFDDQLPYGHGEKSVYILSGYMKLTREEAFAIRYHIGFAGAEDNRNISNVFNKFPLAPALYIADIEATYFLERPET